jgi:hypothetical protein
MQCRVDGCGLDADYKAAQLCQKHYFRQWRNGTTDIVRKPGRPRFEDERGYQFVHAPKHPLCSKGQIYVAEHRAVLYEAIGPGPMCCELCGKGLTWDTVDVDHIDENPRNNARANLRPLCLRCNTWRSMPPAYKRIKNAIAITFDGETKTPYEWARDSRVSVSGGQIRNRKKAGMSDEEALFGPKRTHNGRHSPAYYRAKRKELEKQRTEQ